MNKTQMVENYSETYEVSKRQAADEINRVFEFIQDTLVAGEVLQITGFGTFSTKDKPEYTARNPKDGSEVIVPKHKVPKFKAGAGLKKAVR